MTMLWEVMVLCTNSAEEEASAEYREIAAAISNIAVTVIVAVEAMEIANKNHYLPFSTLQITEYRFVSCDDWRVLDLGKMNSLL